jgi:alkanesulfonate monooxygenase SsuD/methylene tetrahydromethanopterin reductase-like flavin-dependent oxidoreductase (luciferase family)
MAGPRSVALAVRFANEYNTLLASVEDCAERKATLVEACERAGRDPDTLPMSLMATCVLGTDRSEIIERVRRVLRVWSADDQDPEQVLAERAARWVAGTPAEVVEQLHALEGAGVQRVYLQHLAHADVDMVALLGAEVVPAVEG